MVSSAETVTVNREALTELLVHAAAIEEIFIRLMGVEPVTKPMLDACGRVMLDVFGEDEVCQRDDDLGMAMWEAAEAEARAFFRRYADDDRDEAIA